MDTQRLGLHRLSHDVPGFALAAISPISLDGRRNSPDDQLLRLGREIRAARRAAGLSQETLAFEAELDYSTVGKIERGQRNATLVKVMRIAAVLDTSLADLFASAEI